MHLIRSLYPKEIPVPKRQASQAIRPFHGARQNGDILIHCARLLVKEKTVRDVRTTYLRINLSHQN